LPLRVVGKQTSRGKILGTAISLREDASMPANQFSRNALAILMLAALAGCDVNALTAVAGDPAATPLEPGDTAGSLRGKGNAANAKPTIHAIIHEVQPLASGRLPVAFDVITSDTDNDALT